MSIEIKKSIKPVNYLDAIKYLEQRVDDVIKNKAKELNISVNDNLTYQQWITILAKNPELIERPIVLTSKGAVIGRPPENILKVLN